MKDPEHTAADYVKALTNIKIAYHHKRMLQAHYHQTNHTITATQMAKSIGYPNYNAANLHYGKLGRLIGEELGWSPLPEQNIYAIVTFEKPNNEWHWILRRQVVEALRHLGWTNTDYPQMPEEVDATKTYYEGAIKKVNVNLYERSGQAREKCLVHYGCRCAVCGLKLSEKYGETAQGLIHVHHIIELSKIGISYSVNPIEDLRPVCPNCHAVIHSRKPPYTIEEVTNMIEGNNVNVSC